MHSWHLKAPRYLSLYGNPIYTRIMSSQVWVPIYILQYVGWRSWTGKPELEEVQMLFPESISGIHRWYWNSPGTDPRPCAEKQTYFAPLQTRIYDTIDNPLSPLSISAPPLKHLEYIMKIIGCHGVFHRFHAAHVCAFWKICVECRSGYQFVQCYGVTFGLSKTVWVLKNNGSMEWWMCVYSVVSCW